MIISAIKVSQPLGEFYIGNYILDGTKVAKNF